MNYLDENEDELTPEQREQVNNSILSKYRAANSDNAGIEKAEKDAKMQKLALGLTEGISSLAAARAGGGRARLADSSGYWNNLKQGADADVLKARQKKQENVQNVLMEDKLAAQDRENDPNSEESKIAQALAMKLMPNRDFSKASAARLKTMLPSIQSMYNAEQQSLARAEEIKARQTAAQEKLDLKKQEKDEKKKAAMNEIEDRRTNIEDNLTLLEKQIGEDGTWEMMGSHNQDLDRRVETIATDVAKLQDPQSVARPAEVEMIKNNLIKSGFSNRNATAEDILKNFRSEVNKRAANAYKIRGLEDPGSMPQTKVVNGVTYQKVAGGWEAVD